MPSACPSDANHPLKKCSSGEYSEMMDMSDDQAAITHEMMQNGNSAAHQTWLKCIKNDMNGKPAASNNETAKSFSK